MKSKDIVLKKVVKISGSKENFNSEKVIQSIWFTTSAEGKEKERKKLASLLGKQVVETLKKSFPNGEAILTSEIGETVEKVLIENGHAEMAKTFIRFRENKKHLHQKKETLGFEDDVGFSYNTLFIIKERFLKRDEGGQILETPKGMLKRTARFLSDVEKRQEDKSKWYEAFLDIMLNLEFLPGTRTLANAEKSDESSYKVNG